MSAIQQFSMSALADLMIEEETEESYMEDDDDYDRNTLNATDKSLASTQYSADYETEEFEQESVCMESPKHNSTDDDFVDNLEPLTCQAVLEPDCSALTGSTSNGSDSVLDYSDSQNETSSRTLHAMPVNKFSLSPIGPSGRAAPDVKTVNYDDLQEITGVKVDGTEGKDQIVDRENSFEHGHSHSMVQSSPLQDNCVEKQHRPGTALTLRVNSNSNSNSRSTTLSQRQVEPTSLQNNDEARIKKQISPKMAYGRQHKGYSAVTKLSAAEVRTVRLPTSSSSGSGGNRGAQLPMHHSSPQLASSSSSDHNLNPSDINLMREVRKVLNKIEQSDAVSQQVQKVGNSCGSGGA
jgi:hypothetical protein